MFASKKIALLTVLGMLSAGCGSSNGSADQSNAPKASSATAAPAAKAGLQPLTTEQLKVPLTATSASCNIESLGKVPFVNAPLDVSVTPTTISGWVLSDISKKSGLPAQLRFTDESEDAGWQLPIEKWVSRPDVNSTMHGVDSGNVGFVQAVDLRLLPPGSYNVSVTFQDSGRQYSCEKGRVIEK